MSNEKSGGCCAGISCPAIIIAILFWWMVLVGLPTPGGHKYNIDIFPPRIWDMNESVAPVNSK